MKCGAASVLCFLIVCVYQCDSFKLLQKIKDYLHPTTPTTTVIPILNEYEATPLIDTYDSHKTEDQDGLYDSEDSSKSPYTPENFPTIAPPDVAEVYPGMSKHSTTPRSSGSQTIPPGHTNVGYVTNNQEVPTTPQTNSGNGLCDQLNTEQTTVGTVVDNNFSTTTSRTTDQENNNQLQPNQNKTSNTQIMGGSSEQPLVQPQPKPTNNQTSIDSQTDNFVFPDDPSLPEAEEGLRSKNSTVDRVSLPSKTTRPRAGAPVPVGDDGGRHIFDAPSTNCGKGRQLDGKGICRNLARK